MAPGRAKGSTRASHATPSNDHDSWDGEPSTSASSEESDANSSDEYTDSGVDKQLVKEYGQAQKAASKTAGASAKAAVGSPPPFFRDRTSRRAKKTVDYREKTVDDLPFCTRSELDPPIVQLLPSSRNVCMWTDILLESTKRFVTSRISFATVTFHQFSEQQAPHRNHQNPFICKSIYT